MVNVYIVDIVVVTDSRVEVELFVPDMSVGKLLRSCHSVHAAYEAVEHLGLGRFKEMLLNWLSKTSILRRRILVDKAFRNGTRPRPLPERFQPSFWANVAEKNKVAERTRYYKSVTQNRYARVVREMEEKGYVGDNEESVCSDSSSDWSFDLEEHGPVTNFPYEVYFGCGS